jgi:hypothetical protein
MSGRRVRERRHQSYQLFTECEMTQDKAEVFGVVWVDNVLGPFTLPKPDARSAIAAATAMRERGADKIRHCRAVRIASGSDVMETIG